MRETLRKEERMDVVVDLSIDRGTTMLETLLQAEEGMAVAYHIRLPNGRFSVEFHELLLNLITYKNVRILKPLSFDDFPRDLVDRELVELTQESDRRRAALKYTWYKANRFLLDAVEQFDEFVYLTPCAIVKKHGWLAALVASGRASDAPVRSFRRKLLSRTREYLSCGWGMAGWFDGKALRQLPLEDSFVERIENPWRDIGDFSRQKHGPGFCLAGPWLSGFDVPLDFLLFALWSAFSLKLNDPHVWSQACVPQQDVVATARNDECCPPKKPMCSDETVLYEDRGGADKLWASLKGLYLETANKKLMAGDWAVDATVSELPLGGPKNNILVDNQIRFQIGTLRDMFRGERCFIIGNGPSLKHTDLTLLRGEYTIGLNRIYLNYSNMGYQPSFLCVTNPNVIKQFHPEIDILSSVKFLTYRTRNLIKNRWNTYFMESRVMHDFYGDLSGQVWCEGCTVTYCAMQVAFYLGFEEVILVGVDHGFSVTGEPHKLVTATGPDNNHFHPDYFGKGVKWQYPDLPASEVSYRVARSQYEQHGRKILDATVGGELQVFPKIDYLEYMAYPS